MYQVHQHVAELKENEMSEYPTASRLDKEDDKIYVKFSLSKYPFLKNAKIGSKGTANFKGEITSSHTDEEENINHEVTFHDLSNKRENVRV